MGGIIRKARWTGPIIDAKNLIRPPPPPPLLHTATQAKGESLRKYWYRRKRLCCQSLGPGSGEAVSWMRGACCALRWQASTVGPSWPGRALALMSRSSLVLTVNSI